MAALLIAGCGTGTDDATEGVVQPPVEAPESPEAEAPEAEQEVQQIEEDLGTEGIEEIEEDLDLLVIE